METATVNSAVKRIATAKGITIAYKPLKGYFVAESSNGGITIWRCIGSTIKQALAWLDKA